MSEAWREVEAPAIEVAVRAQEPDDVAALAELLNQPQVVRGTLQMPNTSADARRRRLEGETDAVRLVAAIAGEVVGMGVLTRGRDRRAHTAAIEVAVHDAHVGKGAGAALMASLLDQADSWLGLKRVELTVFADNARAISLFERFGFEREGLFRAYAYREGRFVDSLGMARLKGLRMADSPPSLDLSAKSRS